MTRATKLQKHIIEAHFEAKRTGQWNCRPIKSVTDLVEALKAGETCKELFEEMEVRYASVTSILLANTALFGHFSQSYVRDIRKAFTSFLLHFDIF